MRIRSALVLQYQRVSRRRPLRIFRLTCCMMGQDMLTSHHNLRTHAAWDDVVGVKLVDKSSMSVGSVESRRRTICNNQPRIHHRRSRQILRWACMYNEFDYGGFVCAEFVQKHGDQCGMRVADPSLLQAIRDVDFTTGVGLFILTERRCR